VVNLGKAGKVLVVMKIAAPEESVDLLRQGEPLLFLFRLANGVGNLLADFSFAVGELVRLMSVMGVSHRRRGRLGRMGTSHSLSMMYLLVVVRWECGRSTQAATNC